VKLRGQADLVALAFEDLALAGGDVGEVGVAVLARGEAQRVGRRRRGRRRHDESLELALGGVHPCLGRGGACRIGERDQVDATLVVIEGDEPVAEHQRGVGQR
jgi:hypothetical protein